MTNNKVAPPKKIDDLAAEAAQVDTKVVSPPGVAPGPLPTVFNLGQTEVGGGARMVVLQVNTPAGQAVYFLDGVSAEGLGTALIKLGSVTKTGLVVP